jgi:hypothetical protein
VQREVGEVPGDEQRVQPLQGDGGPENARLKLGLAGEDQVRQPGKYEASGEK